MNPLCGKSHALTSKHQATAIRTYIADCCAVPYDIGSCRSSHTIQLKQSHHGNQSHRVIIILNAWMLLCR